MKKTGVLFTVLTLFLIVSLADINNFLSVGISVLFLSLNVVFFVIFGNSTFIILRNIFGLLSVELLAYGATLTLFLKGSFGAEHPLIDAFGIGMSLMFFVGISIFLFMFFLLLNWVKTGEL